MFLRFNPCQEGANTNSTHHAKRFSKSSPDFALSHRRRFSLRTASWSQQAFLFFLWKDEPSSEKQTSLRLEPLFLANILLNVKDEDATKAFPFVSKNCREATLSSR